MTKEQLRRAYLDCDYHEHHGGMMIRPDPASPIDRMKWIIIHPDWGVCEERFDTAEEAARFAWNKIGSVNAPQ